MLHAPGGPPYDTSWESLAAGQLPNAKGTLYTSVDRTSIMNITLVVTDTAAHTVNIYLKRSGGTSRRLLPKDTPMDGDDPTMAALIEVLDQPLNLSKGDVIEGDCDSASIVDYSITGVTR